MLDALRGLRLAVICQWDYGRPAWAQSLVQGLDDMVTEERLVELANLTRFGPAEV